MMIIGRALNGPHTVLVIINSSRIRFNGPEYIRAYYILERYPNG